MARMKVNVTYSDGRVVESTVTPKAEVLFERHFGTSINRAGADMHQEYYYYLAWLGLHLSGREPDDFDTFVSNIDEVENVKNPEDELPEDPTKRAPQLEPSSS